ncbi:MAG: isoprenylcysteine carboxylmethyltransferase family protein [Pseudomonadota bacterium]
MPQVLKWIDTPPVWLAGALLLAWVQARYLSLGLVFGDWAGAVGGVLVALGLLMICAALWQMLRLRTTPVPHRVPSVLVTTGVFALSRNPIYLGDALILTGLILRWDAVVSLALVPVFVRLIGVRFVAIEERRCRAAFGAAYDAYETRTRRWI